MTELVAPMLELIQQYGTLTVVVALAVIMFLMISRTWAKQRDSLTEIQQNSNTAQEIINKRVVKLEDQNTEQAKAISQLQAELAAAKWELNNARLEIVDLQHKLEALEADKSALATERDQLRADLTSAQAKIQALEREVFEFKAQLKAEKDVRETVVAPLIEALKNAIPPRTGDTDKLDAAKVPATDPALTTKGDAS